jgi:SnoaL-like protein
MSRLRTFTAVGFVCLLITSGWVYAQQNSTSPPAALTAQDYADIQLLYARYNQGSDFADTEMWMSIWTDDAVFKPSATQTITGNKALAEFRAARNAARGPQRRHSNSSLVLSPTPGGANGRAYFLLLDTSGKQPVMVSAGYYDDTFVKSAKGWRLKTRTLHNDSLAAGKSSQ